MKKHTSLQKLSRKKIQIEVEKLTYYVDVNVSADHVMV